VTKYSWPDWGSYQVREGIACEVWNETVRSLPVRGHITGDVIGRQPFGVFIRIDHHPDAIGLAEIAAMPRCMQLPHVGERVTGSVLWHADHNCQVKLELTEWAEHEDLLPQFVDRTGEIVTGYVTKRASIGVFVRLADCVEGLIPADKLKASPAQVDRQGGEVSVQVVSVDLKHRRIRLALASASSSTS
jgi:ribosomal protein S1